LERLKEPKRFIFGRYCPEFTSIFMIAMLYAVTVPLIMLAASIYFFLATKVYTHQACFVFFQPFEGGGKLMRLVNRTLFFILYTSILVFTVILYGKDAKRQASSFLIIVGIMTLSKHRSIHQNFIKTSSSLPLTRTRIFDEEYNALVMPDINDHQSANNNPDSNDPSIALRKSVFFRKSVLNTSNELRSSLLSRSSLSQLNNSSISLKVDITEDKCLPSSDNMSSCEISLNENHNNLQDLLERKSNKEKDTNTHTRPEQISKTVSPQRNLHRKKINMGVGQLPLILDEETDSIHENTLSLSYFLYRQPQMNKSTWEIEPRPYRSS